MSELRIMPVQIVRSRRFRVCDRCLHAIQKGKRHELHKAFDPYRKRAGAKKWGAWVSERQHIACPGES